jgi:hypothetical protein
LKNEHHSLAELLTTHNKKKSFATFSAAISSPLPISSPSTRVQRGGNGGGSNDGKGAKDVDPHNKPHHQIWQALSSVDNNPEFTTDLLHTILEASGILKDDLRIASFMVRLCFFWMHRLLLPRSCADSMFIVVPFAPVVLLLLQSTLPCHPAAILPKHLKSIASHSLVMRALQGTLAIPDWSTFTTVANTCFQVKKNAAGVVKWLLLRAADYYCPC